MPHSCRGLPPAAGLRWTAGAGRAPRAPGELPTLNCCTKREEGFNMFRPNSAKPGEKQSSVTEYLTYAALCHIPAPFTESSPFPQHHRPECMKEETGAQSSKYPALRHKAYYVAEWDLNPDPPGSEAQASPPFSTHWMSECFPQGTEAPPSAGRPSPQNPIALHASKTRSQEATSVAPAQNGGCPQQAAFE